MNLDTSKPIKSVSYNGVDVPLFQEAPVLLWTNASPTSSFNAQTLSLPSGYDGFIIETRHGDTDYVGYTFAPNTGYKGVTLTLSSASPSASMRYFTANAASIIFEQGFYYNKINTPYNTLAVPTRIFGVKFTL